MTPNPSFSKRDSTDDLEQLANLKRVFYILQQKAKENKKAHESWNKAYENSKFVGIEMPDKIVDCVVSEIEDIPQKTDAIEIETSINKRMGQ